MEQYWTIGRDIPVQQWEFICRDTAKLLKAQRLIRHAVINEDKIDIDGIFVFTNGDSGAHIYDRVVTHATGHDHPALFWV